VAAETVLKAFVWEPLVDRVVARRMNVVVVWATQGWHRSECNIREKVCHQSCPSLRRSYSAPKDSTASNFGQSVGGNGYSQRMGGVDRGLPLRPRNVRVYFV